MNRIYLSIIVILLFTALWSAYNRTRSAPAPTSPPTPEPTLSPNLEPSLDPTSTPVPIASKSATSLEPQYAGLEQDLSGVHLRLATIGGAVIFEAMYESLSIFEEATGATTEIIYMSKDNFEVDHYLKEQYQAGTVAFDIAWNHTSFFPQYIDFLEPLESYFSPEELAPFSKAILDGSTKDGHLWLMPRHGDISGLYYRTDLFDDPQNQQVFAEQYGYPLAPPETLDQMYDMAEFFTTCCDVYGTQFAGREEALTGRFMELLVVNGGQYFDGNLNPIFNSDAGVLAATWVHDLYINGYIPPDTTDYLWLEVAQNFCDGQIAFYLEWHNWYNYVQDPENCVVAGRFGIARGPVGLLGDVHTGWGGAHGFSIAAASEHKEAAAQLLKFLTSERVLYEEAQLGPLPVRDDVWARIIADASSSDVALDSKRLAIAQAQINEDFFTPPQIKEWIAFSDLWYPQLQQIMLGNVEVKPGLDTAVDETRVIMAR
ncbi:sugar ABC transporter substrate-binding protein [Chloroflexi bacterium TSY]|nr:sugar ABC transporter substrate-binding protein [Chloroflexi bacterium TSY]